VKAAERLVEWQAAIFADPIHFGRWPASIEEVVGERLADKGWAWTAEEVLLVNGTHDGHFFMNHYTSSWARAWADEGCGSSLINLQNFVALCNAVHCARFLSFLVKL
jgi:hypothetical protein